MAQSWVHAEASARHFKAGKPEDYLPIHEWIDQFKQGVGDVRHRAMLHNTKGPWLVQDVFGPYLEVFSEKKNKMIKIPTREVAESHIIEDLGFLPTVEDWLSCMDCKVWMGGKRNKFIGREEMLENTVKIPDYTKEKTND